MEELSEALEQRRAGIEDRGRYPVRRACQPNASGAGRTSWPVAPARARDVSRTTVCQTHVWFRFTVPRQFLGASIEDGRGARCLENSKRALGRMLVRRPWVEHAALLAERTTCGPGSWFPCAGGRVSCTLTLRLKLRRHGGEVVPGGVGSRRTSAWRPRRCEAREEIGLTAATSWGSCRPCRSTRPTFALGPSWPSTVRCGVDA